MPARYVVHVAGPVFTEGQGNESLLAAATLAALDMADEIGGRSIAIPAVSAGIYGYPPDEATRIIAESVAEYLAEGRSSLTSVHLVGFDDAMGGRFVAAVRGLDIEP
jgi:O-acetyl-ADP-ribose deacetylase (regulator of RNase III)